MCACLSELPHLCVARLSILWRGSGRPNIYVGVFTLVFVGVKATPNYVGFSLNGPHILLSGVWVMSYLVGWVT